MNIVSYLLGKKAGGGSGGSSGGSGDKFNAFMQRTITEVTAEDLKDVTSIAQYAFTSCKSLSSVTLPDSVTTLNSYCFSNCISLTSIEIPVGISKIPSHCFMFCSGLESVKCYGSITNIFQNGFGSCSNVLVYDFTANTAVPTLYSSASVKVNTNTQIKVPSALYNEWVAATNWAALADYIVGV